MKIFLYQFSRSDVHSLKNKGKKTYFSFTLFNINCYCQPRFVFFLILTLVNILLFIQFSIISVMQLGKKVKNHQLFLLLAFISILRTIAAQDVFVLKQTIDTDRLIMRFITSTDDNSVVVIGYRRSNLVFLAQNGTEYYEDITNKLNSNTRGMTCGQLTTDEQWLLTTHRERMIFILKRNSATGVYEEYQQISLSGSLEVFYCAITDDHMKFVVERQNLVYIYEFNPSTLLFESAQNISVSSNPSSLDITNDHQYLMVATQSSNAYLYKYDSTSYVLHQTIVLESTANFQKRIWIQDYMQQIVIPDKNPSNTSQLWMKVYNFNEGTQQYEYSSKRIYTQDTGYQTHTISADRRIMVITSDSNNLVVTGLDEGTQNLVQTIQIDGVNERASYLAVNGEYFYQAFANASIIIYKTCNYEGRVDYYLGDDGECHFCNSSLDMFIQNSNCTVCTIPNCFDCVNLTTCLQCDSGYYIDGVQCSNAYSENIFLLKQTLYTSKTHIRFLITTDDNTVMVHSDENAKAFFYDYDGNNFVQDYVYTSNQGSNARYGGDFTSDADWFVTTFLDQSIAILKKNPTTGDYEEHQIINTGGTQNTRYCAITDDHQRMIGENIISVFVYEFNSGTQFFQLVQTISIPGQISCLDITNDHLYIIVATKQSAVYFYKHDGSSYILQQTITLESTSTFLKKVWFTDYMEKIFIPDKNPANSSELWIKMYQFNPTTEQYSYVSKRVYTESTGYKAHMVSKDRKYMALTTGVETLIVGGLNEGKQEIIQTIPFNIANYRAIYIANNGEYFFQVFSGGKIEVYQSCFFTNNTYYYGSDEECHLCDSSMDMFIENYTTCVSCSIANCVDCEDLDTCLQCEQDYYIDAGQCLYCNSSEDKFINNNFQCQVCNLTGCLDCTNLTNCLDCEEQNNYYLDVDQCLYCNNTQDNFINGLQCQLCSLTGCLDCNNLTHCVACDLANNYYLYADQCSYCNNSIDNFLHSGICISCTLVGCLDCHNLTVCLDCDEQSNYYLDSNECFYCNNTQDKFINGQQCQACNLIGCLDCTNLTHCLDCDEQNDYYLDGNQCSYCNSSQDLFINGLLCEPCAFLGCLDCINLTHCLDCDEQNNYYLDGNECSFCNNTQDLFINGLQCQACSLVGCLDCGSLTHCLDCDEQSNYYLDSNQCQYCNNTLDYFINGLQCISCTLIGCHDCYNLTTCLTCEESSDYFLNGSSCSSCSLSYCLDCSSLSDCILCDEPSSYYLNGNICEYCDPENDSFIVQGQCKSCVLEGCLDCQNYTTCLECDKASNFYLDGDHCSLCDPANNKFIVGDECKQCTLPNCVNCSRMGKCRKCDQANGYFMENSKCAKCEIYGCLECESIRQCKTCDAEKHFDLNEYGSCDRVRMETILLIVIPILTTIMTSLIILAIYYCPKREREIEEEKEKKTPDMSNARMNSQKSMKEII